VAENLTVQLEEGWNQVATPYAFAVDWNNVGKNGQVSNELWYYNNSTSEYELRTALAPWEGYFIRALNNSSSLDFQPVESNLTKPVSEISHDDAWKLQIMATADGSRDRFNFAGMNKQANNEYDRFDYGEPPAIDKYVSVSFPHDDWEYPGRYSSDIREMSDQGAVWQLCAESNIAKAAVTLSFQINGDIPADYELWLVDKSLQLPVNLRERDEYQFRLKDKEQLREFELIAGVSAFVEQSLGELAVLPSELTLFPNFPNPFNPETNIKFYLPAAAQVQLEIYNILGQRVKTLIPGTIKNKGFHSIIWDGTGERGDMIASGMYIYILRSDNNIKTRKLVLLR
jgi:hypothetical protein